MKEIIFLVEESPEGGLEAKALDHSIFTDGADLKELEANVRDALICHFEDSERPKVVRLHMVKEVVFAA
ncbi:MAG: 2-oxoisovalerate dehydrogenase [Flavobacteriales bacterium]|jgi:hypothetical protein|nr:2-oxoisovalerate dehydrogenase [Flavobacteriales bacterium]MBK6892093.1 2-oxoisovalerate dehydrogenase [Flavobacteriales bacterium]MBK7246228.1 2-oxoisovalerate dehydrogenase [Flavobacteriales bacterium]MBK7286197.1 2-oxoisovalerate dehydrogenase [Flavobacteriales bacterium]MBK9060006.1 2-oxoisovalerate dehydrogenase [Flavobacteriales bacterium]